MQDNNLQDKDVVRLQVLVEGLQELVKNIDRNVSNLSEQLNNQVNSLSRTVDKKLYSKDFYEYKDEQVEWKVDIEKRMTRSVTLIGVASVIVEIVVGIILVNLLT